VTVVLLAALATLMASALGITSALSKADITFLRPYALLPGERSLYERKDAERRQSKYDALTRSAMERCHGNYWAKGRCNAALSK
jgi:hypothetical protein